MRTVNPHDLEDLAERIENAKRSTRDLDYGFARMVLGWPNAAASTCPRYTQSWDALLGVRYALFQPEYWSLQVLENSCQGPLVSLDVSPRLRRWEKGERQSERARAFDSIANYHAPAEERLALSFAATICKARAFQINAQNRNRYFSDRARWRGWRSGNDASERIYPLGKRALVRRVA